MELLLLFSFYAIPIAAVAFFLVCLFNFCMAKHKNKRVPGSVSEEELKKRKIYLIVSAVIAGVLVTVQLIIHALLTISIAYM